MIQFFKDLILKDLLLKLVSLMLAIATWATVSSLIRKRDRDRGITMGSYQQFTGVPVSVVSGSSDVSRYQVVPAQVHIVVQGRPEAIESLEVGQVRADVDLTYWDPRSGRPQPVLVSTPPGTSLVSVSPVEVEVVPPEQQP